MLHIEVMNAYASLVESELENFSFFENEMNNTPMEEELDATRSRKRTRDHPTLAERTSQSLDEDDLETSMKKVRISKQSPGQLRLQQDVAECIAKSGIPGIEFLRIDGKHPLHAHLRFANGKEYIILAGRFYPHQPPIVVCVPREIRLQLPILEKWLPVYTLSDLIIDILHNDP